MILRSRKEDARAQERDCGVDKSQRRDEIGTMLALFESIRLTEHDDCAHAIFVYQVYRSNSLIDLCGGAGAEMKWVLELAKTVCTVMG